MHLIEKKSFLYSLVMSGWKYKIVQLLLVAPALIYLMVTVFYLSSPKAPPKADPNVEKLQGSIQSLNKEVTRLQQSVGNTVSDLKDVYKRNLSLRGVPAAEPAPTFEQYESALKTQKAKASVDLQQLAIGDIPSKSKPVAPESPKKQTVAKPYSAPASPSTPTSTGYVLKDSELVVDAHKLSNIESYLASVSRVVDILVTEVQTIKATLTSIGQEKKSTNYVDLISISGNLASVFALLLSLFLAVHKRRTQSIVNFLERHVEQS